MTTASAHQRIVPPRGDQAAGEQGVLAAELAERHVEGQALAADLGEVEQQVVGRGDVDGRAGRESAAHEEASLDDERVGLDLVLAAHRADDGRGTASRRAADQLPQPVVGGPLVVVDEDQQVAVAALGERPVAGRGDARRRPRRRSRPSRVLRRHGGRPPRAPPPRRARAPTRSRSLSTTSTRASTPSPRRAAGLLDEQRQHRVRSSGRRKVSTAIVRRRGAVGSVVTGPACQVGDRAPGRSPRLLRVDGGRTVGESLAGLSVVVVNYGSTDLLRQNLAPSRGRPSGLVVVVVDN